MHLNDIFWTNLARAKRWHNGNIDEWSALEWAAAMAGEAGEAANAAKKLKRLEGNIQSINHDEDHLSAAVSELHGRHYVTIDQAQKAVAKEVADTIIYGLLVMARVGIDDPEAVIRSVFNRKSEEYDFPERLSK